MTTPDELRAAARRARQEADDLRRLAGRVDASQLHRLPSLADDRVWVGPLASALRDRLRRSLAELGAASGDLRGRALRLDQEATDLDRAAARAEVLASIG